MPSQLWRHACGEGEVVEGSPQCATCGTRGAFDGWHLSMWEAASVYRKVYGLGPIGPHRRLAHFLFAGMRDECVDCGGRAVLTLDEETWQGCRACDATGGAWNRTAEEIEGARRHVLAKWPNAALPREAQHGSPMTLDRANGPDLGHDIALVEYEQQLWRMLRRVKTQQDRQSLLREVERLNLHGRKVLYTEGTVE